MDFHKIARSKVRKELDRKAKTGECLALNCNAKLLPGEKGLCSQCREEADNPKPSRPGPLPNVKIYKTHASA